MPELPEVEILARHLRPLLYRRVISEITVRRRRSIRPTPLAQLKREVCGKEVRDVSRRGKYLLFELRGRGGGTVTLLGHLGMAGRMFLARMEEELPKHAAVVFGLGRHRLVFEDHRYFGRIALDLAPLHRLGPEPLGPAFSVASLAQSLKGSRQAIKVKLMDQATVAGVGNIYASEALFRAGISPARPAGKLGPAEVARLRRAVRATLEAAIRCGSTVPLKSMSGKSDALFYYGGDGENAYARRLRVYDRAGKPCVQCGAKIRRIVQGGRSTFFCPRCQKAGK